MRGRRKKKVDNFEELEEPNYIEDEFDNSDEVDEEVNLDQPNFDNEVWKDYAEDIDFEE